MGIREREIDRIMLKTRQLERLTPESHETLRTILETLPGALFVLDDASTIIYANASAQALTGVAPEILVGNNFWRCAPQLVSTALYQAIQKTKQTRALTEVQYVSPVTGSWLHVHLSPTSGGLTLQFHEMGAPAQCQEIVHQRESLYMDVLENVHAGFVFLTPEGIVLDLNEVPLDDAQIQREEVVGKPLVKAPGGPLLLTVKRNYAQPSREPAGAKRCGLRPSFTPGKARSFTWMSRSPPTGTWITTSNISSSLASTSPSASEPKRKSMPWSMPSPSWSGPGDRTALSTIIIGACATIPA